jgi:hypothetical protein
MPAEHDRLHRVHQRRARRLVAVAQVGCDPLEGRQRVVALGRRARVHEDQATDDLRALEREAHERHPALREPGEDRRALAEVLDQRGGIAAHVPHRPAAGSEARVAVAGPVERQAAIAIAERVDLRAEHLAAGEQPVTEHDNRAGTLVDVRVRRPVEGCGRHVPGL